MTDILNFIAHHLEIKPEEVDKTELKKAIKTYECEGKVYWNALAHSGQLHNNVPRKMMIFLCYQFLMGEL